MYLKSLALSGFKTFADDTRLEFGPGITAIVGPNGSGKSNVVDGILWALGERSNKALRGHAPTDVIFNGSAARPQMGLAEVSLFFDNADKTLPLAFDEVQVSRRLFRNGDSEYSLNNTNCRLKDVVDLFLDTGVGPDSYTIVSQRDIDAILSAKAEDRRGLIEGAAGVQKYRARRSETRRKLDRVETDLLRVLDITSELETQLAPLAQQAELAREYDNYVRRLRELQLALLARDYDVRLKRRAALNEQKTAGDAAVQTARATLAQLEETESQLETQMRALEAQMDVLQSETTDVVSRLTAEEGAIAVARERRRALTEQQEFQAQEIGLLRARIVAARESIAGQRSELDAAQTASAGLSDAAAQAEAQLGAAAQSLSEATRELQKAQAQVIETMRASQSKREAAAAARAQAESLNARRADLEKLAATLTKEIEAAASTRAQSDAQLKESKARASAAEKRIEAARERISDAQREYSQHGETLNATREKRSALSSRLNVLRELEENLEGVQGGARALLSAVKRGQIGDDFTLVADAIRAPQELEQAIEVALGAGVHNLVCAGDADAKSAIAFLKKNQAGRATFLPLESLRPSSAGERTRGVLRENGVRGLASELVSFDKSLRPAVEYLLARVLVVDDLEVATKVARRCDFGTRLVTLEGELVLPGGAITGGRGRQKAAGLLARKRELDEAEAKIGALQKEIETKNAAQNEARAALDDAQKTLRVAQDEAGEARQQVARQEREVEHGEREERRIRENLRATQAQLSQIGAQLQTRAAQQEGDEKEAGVAEERARVLDAAVSAAQEIVAGKQREREEIASSVADVRAEYSATHERQNAMRRAVAELEKQVRDFESQIESKQSSIARAAGEDAHLVTREAGHVSALAQLQARRDALEKEFAAWREARQSGLKSVEETGKSLRETRRALHENEEESHKIEVRLASTEAEIAESERRFAEEFEMEIEEALPHRETIESKQAAQEEIESLKEKVGQLGSVNVGAIAQHEQVKERLDFLTAQRADLDAARAELDEIIQDIDNRTRERFMTTFTAIAREFDVLFQRVFDGGTTHLSLTNPDDLLETGIDLRVQPPGKGAQDISLLSGGERALTALSFMLALLRVRPSPFVVLDEVDAPLDQSNVGRFSQLLREFTDQTQFIVITHNNGTMQAADVLYGVTMQQQGVSKLVSVRLVDDTEAASTRAE